MQFRPTSGEFDRLLSNSGIDGDGAVHVRVRVCSPVPHDFVHDDQSDQDVNPPSTKRESTVQRATRVWV